MPNSQGRGTRAEEVQHELDQHHEAGVAGSEQCLSEDPSDECRKRLSRRLDSRPAVAGLNLRLATPSRLIGRPHGTRPRADHRSGSGSASTTVTSVNLSISKSPCTRMA